MPILATWIREVDAAAFGRWFAERPDLDVRNARLDDPPYEPSADPLPPGAAGLLLSGGPDISAEFLQQPVPDPSVIEDPELPRDRWEFAALEAALTRRLPILAICKGVQVLNVGLGGTLHLDIPAHDAAELRDGNLQALRYAADAPDAPRFETVNSSHHQALDKLGNDLVIEAWSASDGIIEQVRLRDYPYCVGVQYHPERHARYAPLFHEFFDRLSAGSPARIHEHVPRHRTRHPRRPAAAAPDADGLRDPLPGPVSGTHHPDPQAPARADSANPE